MSRTHALDLLLLVNSLFAGDLERFHEQEGMTGPRVMLMWQLGSAGPCTQRELATALGVTPRNVTGLVDGLVASGHVSREPHPSDRRATLVTPTPAGAAFLDRIRCEHEELAERLFEPLGAERLTEFTATLGEVADRLAGLIEEDRRG